MHLTKITSAALWTVAIASLAVGCGGKGKNKNTNGLTGGGVTTGNMTSSVVFNPGTPTVGFLPGLVTAVDPARGSIYGGTQVTLTGNNLFMSGATVFFDGTPATNVVVVSASQITCITPAHAVGLVDVEVRLANGNRGQLPNGFTYEETIPARVADYGDPSGPEQELLELANRARKDPAAEGRRLGLDFTKYTPKPPLSHNEFLAKAALAHTQDMAARAFFDHPNPDGVNANGRVLDSGYDLNAAFGTSRTVNRTESIAGASANMFRTAQAVHDAFMIDAGLPFPKHREIILGGPGFERNREAGMAFRLDLATSGNFPNLTTQEFAYTKTDKPFIVGTVFNDANSDGISQTGEGRYNVPVTLRLVGTPFSITTNTKAQGGYAFEIFLPGQWEIEIQGQRQLVTITQNNVKIDLRGSTITLQE